MQRAGLLIPSSNTTVEHEYNRFGPDQVSWHAGRLHFTTLSRETLASQEDEMLREAEKLATTRPGLILVCQTAVGFILGAEDEAALTARLNAACGIPVLSLASLMTAALRAMAVSRIALATPFPSAVESATTAYLEAAGFEILHTVSLGLRDNFALAAVPVERLSALVQEADGPGVEAVVIPGGNLRLLGVLDSLEASLGKPVLTTNQIGLWAAAGALGLSPRPIGRLSVTPYRRAA